MAEQTTNTMAQSPGTGGSGVMRPLDPDSHSLTGVVPPVCDSEAGDSAEHRPEWLKETVR